MKKNQNSKTIKPGGIPAYISACPKEVHTRLKEMRAAIRDVAPDAIDTLSYFEMPGGLKDMIAASKN